METSMLQETVDRIAVLIAEHPAAQNQLRDFVKGYMICALWAETDNADDSGGEPLDANYDIDDIHATSLDSILTECADFVISNHDDLIAYARTVQRKGDSAGPWEFAGHDFWLTRNGHGCGFWDRDGIADELGERLSEASRAAGESDVEVGDDGSLHFT
jgi:hypothetical protein